MEARPVKGFENEYTVDKDGNLFSIRKGRYKAQIVTGRGYKSYHMCKNGFRVKKMIHRLVYETFVGEIPKGFEINHLDGNKLNSSLENLELCTHSQNIKHAYTAGLIHHWRWPKKIDK